MKFYVDGSKNENDCAICIYDEKNKKRLKIFECDYSVHEIEYIALIECLKTCPPGSKIFSDRKQIVEEVNLRQRVKRQKNFKYFSEARILMEEKNCRVLKIPRFYNLAGRYLEQRLNKLKDYKNNMGKDLIRRSKKEIRKKRYKKMFT